MNYYLMSAGSLPNQDYRWWQFSEDEKLMPADPPLIRQLAGPTGQLSDWLDDEGVSILLGQCKKLPGLLITSLPTGRCDYQQRPIRNYFGCQATSPDEQLAIRTLTASALADYRMIGDALDQAVTTKAKSKAVSSDPGFKFDWQQWENALHHLFSVQIQDDHSSEPINEAKKWGRRLRFRIAKDSWSRRKELIQYLLNDDLPLPKHLTIILLATRYKESAFFWANHHKIGAVLSALEESAEWQQAGLIRRLTGFIRGFSG